MFRHNNLYITLQFCLLYSLYLVKYQHFKIKCNHRHVFVIKPIVWDRMVSNSSGLVLNIIYEHKSAFYCVHWIVLDYLCSIVVMDELFHKHLSLSANNTLFHKHFAIIYVVTSILLYLLLDISVLVVVLVTLVVCFHTQTFGMSTSVCRGGPRSGYHHPVRYFNTKFLENKKIHDGIMVRFQSFGQYYVLKLQ